MSRKNLLLSAALLGLTIGGGFGRAETNEKERAELAKALQGAKLTLEDGLRASGKSGDPISAKFEVEDGKLQFSAYTIKGEAFTEFVADPQTGAVAKTDAITDKDDLEAAQTQKAAMQKATMPLLAATDKAVKANTGFRAVSIYPSLEGGHPVAAVTLLKDDTFKTVPEKLD